MKIDYSLNNIKEAALKLKEKSDGFRVFAFSGELGAGKTTFISAFCSLLGVTEIVSSPTFSIVQQYDSPHGNIYHLDLYRIRSDEEAFNSGLGDTIDSGDICMVEWPENAPALLPLETVSINFKITGEDTRELDVEIPRSSR